MSATRLVRLLPTVSIDQIESNRIAAGTERRGGTALR
jgi:hypothetical protein